MKHLIFTILAVSLTSQFAFAGTGALFGNEPNWPGNYDAMECWSGMSEIAELKMAETVILAKHNQLVRKEFSDYNEADYITTFQPAMITWNSDYFTKQLSIDMNIMVRKKDQQVWDAVRFAYYVSYSNPWFTALKNDAATRAKYSSYNLSYGMKNTEELYNAGFNLYANSCQDVHPVMLSTYYFPIQTRAGHLIDREAL